MRQRPNHYSIHAGRNLPDKEFRYLKTVIVAAAVYWGFSSVLRLRLHVPLTFQHRAGVSPSTSSLEFAQTCVFVKQSLEPFLCGPSFNGHLFSRSYEVILPSSLTRVLSFVLGFSPHLPVSVCGTGASSLLAAFLASVKSSASVLNFPPRHSSELTRSLQRASLTA